MWKDAVNHLKCAAAQQTHTLYPLALCFYFLFSRVALDHRRIVSHTQRASCVKCPAMLDSCAHLSPPPRSAVAACSYALIVRARQKPVILSSQQSRKETGSLVRHLIIVALEKVFNMEMLTTCFIR